MTNPPISALQDAIRNLHGCESQHLESVPVTERWDDEVVWDGVVEVFDLIGHETALWAYAWSHVLDDSGQRRFVAVLHEGPVDSPESAVRAAVVAEIRERERDERSP